MDVSTAFYLLLLFDLVYSQEITFGRPVQIARMPPDDLYYFSYDTSSSKAKLKHDSNVESWIIHSPGLNNRDGTISIESWEKRGFFLRRRSDTDDAKVYLESITNGPNFETFYEDATFTLVPNPGGYKSIYISFEDSMGRLMRHGVGSGRLLKFNPSSKADFDMRASYQILNATVSHSCQNGWISYSSHCYKVIGGATYSQSEAENECQNFNGHLVSIATEEDEAVIVGISVLNGLNKFWLGLTFDVQGTSTWTD
ncbi:unnamed protein product, partial [Owenia fusiformis]